MDESSLLVLALAEAIARKVSKYRAFIVQNRISDPVLSQESFSFLAILNPLNPTTQKEATFFLV